MKILFVCLGNICRSPIAEGVMKHIIQQANLNWIIESASTNAFHTGESPHRNSQKVCKEHDIDISKQKARRFQKSDLAYFDKIYAMAEDVLIEMKSIAHFEKDNPKIDLFLNALYPNQNKSVTDPWYGELDGYYKVYDEIEKGCVAIFTQLT
jgi:protein-tyrosine phosphatase